MDIINRIVVSAIISIISSLLLGYYRVVDNKLGIYITTIIIIIFVIYGIINYLKTKG